ncbi:hypothetical protein [Clostridium sp. UBA6640]|uniref:hypothetical protein n=1 Tax=Clostridium sp. UBA6640 TaxID=1946370 RepID=UPI0025C0343E|nr:hypothetical protein [Clostridium sp. UBA6640]
MNKIKKLIMICAFLIFSLTLVGCGTSPETVVEDYFNTLKSKGFIEASNFTNHKLTEEASKDLDDTLMNKKIQTALSSRIEYKILESRTTLTNAKVKVKVNYIDLVPIADRLHNDIIPIVVKDLLEGKTCTLERSRDIELNYICDSVKDKNAETAMLVLDINLKRSFKNHWTIATNDEFFKVSLGDSKEADKKLKKSYDKLASMSKKDGEELIENFFLSMSPEEADKFLNDCFKNMTDENRVEFLREYLKILPDDMLREEFGTQFGVTLTKEDLNNIKETLNNLSDEELKDMVEEILANL